MLDAAAAAAPPSAALHDVDVASRFVALVSARQRSSLADGAALLRGFVRRRHTLWAGATLSGVEEHATLLHYAVYGTHPPIVALLLALGASRNKSGTLLARTNDGFLGTVGAARCSSLALAVAIEGLLAIEHTGRVNVWRMRAIGFILEALRRPAVAGDHD